MSARTRAPSSSDGYVEHSIDTHGGPLRWSGPLHCAQQLVVDRAQPVGNMPIDPLSLARSLIDIDSTTGREGEAGAWLARLLRERGYSVVEQPVSDGRFNVFAHHGEPPRLVLSTHFDCVP